YEIYEKNPVDRTPRELGGSHGTHVSGIIGARANNTGVAGLNWKINILPIKVLGDDGSGNTFDIAEGIYYAIDNNADIINLSLGGPADNDKPLKLAIEEAHQNDIIIVAAAGNNGDNELLYPARYEECIGVGAVDENLELASYSHYGQDLELVAPGSNILSSWGYYEQDDFTTGYQYLTGTSMAAPYVSGVAALLLARGIHPQDIRERLTKTAVDLGKEGHDRYYGYGLVDAYAALLGRKLTMPYVFATAIKEENGEKFMNIRSSVTTTDREGNYLLEDINPDGEQVYIIGWRDVNENYVVDEGDYFGKTPYDGQNEINLDISYLEKSNTETGLTVKDTSSF
ncbi:MAG: S8 family serine peptidase, partial [Halanaerobiaceae bacterium]